MITELQNHQLAADKFAWFPIGLLTAILCYQSWKLCGSLWPSEGHSHRASDSDIDSYVNKLHRDENRKQLKKLRDSWVTWDSAREQEFQSLWEKEQAGVITEPEIDRLDTLTICKQRSEK